MSKYGKSVHPIDLAPNFLSKSKKKAKSRRQKRIQKKRNRGRDS